MKSLKIIGQLLLLGILAFLSFLMLKITLTYFPVSTKVGFLRIKQWMFREYPASISKFWFTAFYIHVITSMIVLLAGFTQFSKRLYKYKIHRKMGKLYVLIVVFLSGPTGLIMGYFANGGIYSQVAFMLLSVLWMLATFLAFRYAVLRSFDKHKYWMIISFSLTLSALTLRAWKYLFTAMYDLEMRPMDLYRAVAWLGWVPNLLVALIIVAYQYRKRKRELTNNLSSSE